MIALVIDPDVIRVLALFACAVAFGTFPMAAWAQGRPRSAWLAIIGAELLIFRSGFIVVQHWGEPLVWHRTPLIFVASLFFIAFAWASLARGR